MASLTITTNLINESLNATNTKANALLKDYGDAIGATGTANQKAQTILLSLVHHMQEQARQHRRNAQTAAALAAIQTEMDGLRWE